ncbi:MAG TPA: hypothetical protein VMB35_08160 [Methanomicrobiales archaeon]|nr:hypothetical protein [Methanomicrobiales archaeon]
MSGRARFPVSLTAAALLAFPLVVSAALGAGMQVQPAAIGDGSPISLSFANVTDGDVLAVTLAASFHAPSSPAWFNVTNWRYAFGIQGGNITVTGTNVNRVMLLSREGTTIRRAENTGTGNIQVMLPVEIQPGVYYDYRVLYEVHASGDPVSITIVQQGTKAGADDSSSTPSIFGVGEGNLTISSTDNGIPVGMAQVLVGSNLPVPVPENTTATTPGVPETTGTPGASGTPPASLTPPAVTATGPPTTVMVTAAPAGQTPAPGPVDTQPPGWFFTMITGFALVIIVISVIADYLIMRD